MRSFLALVLLAAGCNQTEIHRASNTDEFEQAPSNLVDILWVIDNSKSMGAWQSSVARGAEDFTANLETTSMDFHLGVITTDVDRTNPYAGVLLGQPPVLTGATPQYASEFGARVMQGEDGDDQEKGLQAAVTALSPPLVDTINQGFLRDGAMLSVVILSDENDCSDNGALGATSEGDACYTRPAELTPVTDLVRQLVDLKGGDPVVISGIVGPEDTGACVSSVPGRRYHSAFALLGGVSANICETDYSVIMDALGEVATGILTVFQLTKAAVEETIEVTVQLDEDAEPLDVAPLETGADGWTYIEEYAQIEFHGAAIPPRGALIKVKYDVAGQVEEREDEAVEGGL
ncbi:MAG: hypothetical protein V4850_25260 [Myxococcota bacterium]